LTRLLGKPFAKACFDFFLRQCSIDPGIIQPAPDFVGNIQMILDILDRTVSGSLFRSYSASCLAVLISRSIQAAQFAFAQAFEKGSAIDGLRTTTLNVVVAAIERFASLGKFLRICGQRVLDQSQARAGLGSQVPAGGTRFRD
jgi:hypothetical protein